MDDNFSPQTIEQKKMAFAGSEHVAIVIRLLQECGGAQKLVGQNEFETIVNAVTLDAQKNLIENFINAIDSIKQGNLHKPQ